MTSVIPSRATSVDTFVEADVKLRTDYSWRSKKPAAAQSNKFFFANFGRLRYIESMKTLETLLMQVIVVAGVIGTADFILFRRKR